MQPLVATSPLPGSTLLRLALTYRRNLWAVESEVTTLTLCRELPQFQRQIPGHVTSSPSSSLSYLPISAVLMVRGYAMHQNSFFRTSEWDWLKKAVMKPDIQEWIAKQNYSNVRMVLMEGFQKKFMTPAEGGEQGGVQETPSQREEKSQGSDHSHLCWVRGRVQAEDGCST